MLWDEVKDLPFEVGTVTTTVSTMPISPEFERKTTTVAIGDGAGEDVTYAPPEHDPARFPQLDLRGTWTLESFSARLDELELFPGGKPDQSAYRDYRRWAFESSAFDHALQSNGLDIASALGREPEPVRFVSSNRRFESWIALYPAIRFKLDTSPDWTGEFVADLAAKNIADVVDLKGQYHGTVVDSPPDAALYRRVAESFPNAWIEDPALTPETDAVLEPHRGRVTWDAPIHSWADVERLPFAPKCLNCKPSRFGKLERLLEFYERCDEHGIALYGGGQFELGIGRGQIQVLASLFHADAPNDVAPGGYNATEAQTGLETSPLAPKLTPLGFRRDVG